MNVIKDRPDWLLYLTLDGHSSYLQAFTCGMFDDHKIQLVFEDGDKTQANQVFDQQKVKEDKRSIHGLLDSLRLAMKAQLDKFSLIKVCIEALKRSTQSAWIN